MKLSVAIAPKNALASAFVVFRGIEESARNAADLGYNGIELALRRASDIDPDTLLDLTTALGLEVSCISTGQVFADLGYSFTDEDRSRRDDLFTIFYDLIDIAPRFGGAVNIGRVRGHVDGRPYDRVQSIFVESAQTICDHAAAKGVRILLEPVNRYEIDFINSVEEGVSLMKAIDRDNMKLMPDLFHMNIEDRTLADCLAENIEYIGYVHFADSNRLAPGWGHIDFEPVLERLHAVGYSGWISIEILPKPEPLAAAKQAVDHLRPMIDRVCTGRVSR